jgi:hypothetical protein
MLTLAFGIAFPPVSVTTPRIAELVACPNNVIGSTRKAIASKYMNFE